MLMTSFTSPRLLLRRVIVLAASAVLIWLAVLLAVRVSAAGGGADPAPAVSSYSAASVLPGCILLAASEDPYGHRHGMEHPYAGYPVVMTLACISLDDVDTARALFPVEITSRDEALAQGGVVPY
jgi:hypothetical protein